MQIGISRKGYSINKKGNEKEINEIKKELSVSAENYSKINKKEIIKVYKENEKKIYIPKQYGIKKYGNEINEIQNNKLNEKEWEREIKFNGKLRENQIEPSIKCYEKIKENGGGILQLPCGFGKTCLSIYLMSKIRLKTLIIVHKEFLLNQWKESINKFLPEARIGIIQGSNIEIENKEIIIGMLQSISMKEYYNEIFDGIGFVIFDECHFLGAKVFSQALFKITSKYMLGLSATPTRVDGLDKIFRWHLGDVIYSTNREIIGKTPLVKTYYYFQNQEAHTYKEYRNFKGDIVLSKILTQIIENDTRNNYIIDKIIEIIKENNERKILVLSERRSQLEKLNDKLIKFSEFNKFNKINIESGLFIGGMKEKERNKSSKCQVIFGTYQMASVGLDIDGLNTLVLASSKPGIIKNIKGENISGSMDQSIGRIFRKIHDKITPYIIDIADQYSVFKTQCQKRKTYYRNNKYVIENYNTYELKNGSEIKEEERIDRRKTKKENNFLFME